ncbi:RNA polymerase sigma-70 factor [Daejeonella sp. JGW-45]|uniref:RNA polymerase sigma-70 factor n=1 Tax=Daejeonella sp. JGW-45 TaxID=3034148 RepID=UPI0023EC3F19|nr:RNA polymerase sigma-70 factor [Daejeonella sp. JGW-45]
MENEDIRLTELIRKGDKPSFDRVFLKYFKNLHAYAMKFAGEKDMAEEIIQNVFCRIWEKRGQLKADGYLRAFLYRSVHNECVNYIRHRKVRSSFQVYYVGKPELNESNLAEELGASELERRLYAAINELPEECASVFQMSRFEQLRYGEIAAELDIPLKAVEYQMGKALKILRIKLADFLPLLLIYLNKIL